MFLFVGMGWVLSNLINRVLSGIKITSLSTLAEAITVIHKTYSIPHIIITSVHLSKFSPSSTITPSPNSLTVIGSTTRSDGSPRLFRVDVPVLDCYFSGTGDMFAALTVCRLREAVFAAGPNLRTTKSWVSPDEVAATDLPLAQSTVKVLASMHSVLEKTLEARDVELRAISADTTGTTATEAGSEEERQKEDNLRRSKAAEVRLIRHTRFLREPTVVFEAKEWRKEDLPLSLQ